MTKFLKSTLYLVLLFAGAVFSFSLHAQIITTIAGGGSSLGDLR